MLPLRPQFHLPQMRSFDVILQAANEPLSPSEQPAGTGTFYRLPQCIGAPTAGRTEHRKRATLISSRGRALCTPPPLLRTGPGSFPSKPPIPWPEARVRWTFFAAPRPCACFCGVIRAPPPPPPRAGRRVPDLRRGHIPVTQTRVVVPVLSVIRAKHQCLI